MALLWLTGLISAISASLAAIFVTSMIELFGGAVGGILGSIPTVIVPFSIGVSLISDDQQKISRSLYTVCLGMLCNVILLVAWRYLPRLAFISNAKTLSQKLLFMVPTTLTIWLCCATSMIYTVQAMLNAGGQIRMICFPATAMSAIIGFILLFSQNVNSPRGQNKVGPLTYVCRGLFSGLIIGCSIALSQVNTTIAGIAAVFPGILTTAMAGLYISQGAEVVAGAIAPLALGIESTSVYAILFAELQPALLQYSSINQPARLSIALLVSFITAIVTVNFPLFYLLQWNARRVASKSNVSPTAASVTSKGEERDTLDFQLTSPSIPVIPPYQRESSSYSTVFIHLIPKESADTLDKRKQ